MRGDYVYRLKKQIREMQVSLEEKNKALDAKEELTEEIVKLAEQNTERLREYYENMRLNSDETISKIN